MDDGTKRLLSELEALRREHASLLSLVKNSKALLYRMSLPEGRYEFVNDASRELFGYTPEEFYQSPLLIRNLIPPDWQDYFHEQWERLLAGTMPPSYEYPILHKSGERRWMFQQNILIRNQSGNPVAIEGIVTDNTERRDIEEALRESEARLLEAQQMAHLGHWSWDIRTGAVTWSREIYNIFRLDPMAFTPRIDSILALSPWPEEHRRGEELIQKAISGHEQGAYEQRFLYPDGGIGYYFSTFHGIYDETGELTALKGTVQDITERKRSEEEKARLEEQYRQAQKLESIGRLAGGIAHDLNNLLTPMVGFAELLMLDVTDGDPKQEALSNIISAGLKAKDLVSRLLSFGRRQFLFHSLRDVKDIIQGLEPRLRATLREDIQLRLRIAPECQTIRADVGQIEQALLNIVENAQEAMPKGGTLTIETARLHAETNPGIEAGDYVLLSISDTGCGMDEKTRGQLFEPFFSSKGKLSAGLGLATVYGIIKQHKGHVLVSSRLRQGTTVQVYLPFSEAPPA